ncbi:MAG: hypothetical protein HS117_15025 [Verrucomicrobiaceae bacterium]|nr:hypothetical protein [Verrucomicrobiaceae bacterium]
MKTLLAIIVLSTVLASAWAQEATKIGVKLEVSGDTGLEGQVKSYFSREFREIGDIEITEGEAFLAIGIIIMEPKNHAGQSLGYVMSVVVTDQTSVLTFGLAAMASTSDAQKAKQIGELIPKGGILVNHLLQTLNSTQLQETCKALAAQIDGTHLDRVRTRTRQLRAVLQNRDKK